jgi:hypothetical protein
MAFVPVTSTEGHEGEFDIQGFCEEVIREARKRMPPWIPWQDQDDAVQTMLLSELAKMQRHETTLLDGTKSVGYVLKAAVSRAIDAYRSTHPRSRVAKPGGGRAEPGSRLTRGEAKRVLPATMPEVDHVRLRNELDVVVEKPPLLRIRKHMEVYTDPDVLRFFEDLVEDRVSSPDEQRAGVRKIKVKMPRREKARRLGWSVERLDAVKRRFLTICRHLRIARQDWEK